MIAVIIVVSGDMSESRNSFHGLLFDCLFKTLPLLKLVKSFSLSVKIGFLSHVANKKADLN